MFCGRLFTCFSVVGTVEAESRRPLNCFIQKHSALFINHRRLFPNSSLNKPMPTVGIFWPQMPGTSRFVNQHAQHCESRRLLAGKCRSGLVSMRRGKRTDGDPELCPCRLPSISSHWSLNSSTAVEDSYHFDLLHGLLFLFTLFYSYFFTRAAITKSHKLSGPMQQKVILLQTLMLMSDSRCRWGCDSSGASFNPCLLSRGNHDDSPCVSLPSMIRTSVIGLKLHPKSEQPHSM